MKYSVAFGSVDRVVVPADDAGSDAPMTVGQGDIGPALAGTAGAIGSAALPRRRRQILRIAHVVGFTNLDWRDRKVDDAAVNNVERLLQARLDRRQAGLVAKRALDIVGSAFALLLLLPLLSLTALAVWLTTPGPVIYSQLRHGLNGRPFRVYKFRTLYADRCDPSGVAQATPGDARITPLGRLMRRTNIDELPQLWNVLVGDMSLVGPRPHPIGLRAGGVTYEELVLAYPLRTLVKPGITGLAQLRGYRGPTTESIPARMRIVCDLAYVANFSVLLDIKIMLFTVLRELRGGTGG